MRRRIKHSTSKTSQTVGGGVSNKKETEEEEEEEEEEVEQEEEEEEEREEEEEDEEEEGEDDNDKIERKKERSNECTVERKLQKIASHGHTTSAALDPPCPLELRVLLATEAPDWQQCVGAN